MAFAKAPLNSVISPAFFPGAGSSRAASGLFHLNAKVATSPMMRAMALSLVSPASGTVIHAARANSRVCQNRVEPVCALSPAPRQHDVFEHRDHQARIPCLLNRNILDCPRDDTSGGLGSGRSERRAAEGLDSCAD